MYHSVIRKQLLFTGIFSIAFFALFTNSSIVLAEQEKAKITGSVHMITDTAELPSNLKVQLIVLEETKQPTSISSNVDKNGNFEFVVNSNERYNYIPLLIYNGVRYLSEPQSLQFGNTSGNKKIHFDIYENTSNHSTISVEQTKITLMRLQRSNSTLTFRREDSIRQSDQYVYIGDGIGHTIQIPLFQNTVDARAEGEYLSEFQIEGKYLTTRMPLRPGLNKIITTHIVSYEKDEDSYLLSIINAFPNNLIQFEIPEDFVTRVDFKNSDSWIKNTTEVNNVPLQIFSKNIYIQQEKSTDITLVGLSGLNSSHVFTTATNSIVALLLSLTLISVIATIYYRKTYGKETKS
tara:strand:- start:1527 stop:2573 length:1047 start_codon:yes stop_codon:yes gene_type:complete